MIPNSYHISKLLCQEIDCYYWLSSAASTMQTREITTETTDLDICEKEFCGRYRFRQYMLQKPGRYSIKYWILADAECHYCFNWIPFLGKEGDTPAVNLGATVVTKLVETIRNTYRKVTCDRFFTSVDLFEDLHKHNPSAVVTVKANRKNLPVKLFPSQAKERTVGDSIFVFKKNTAMVSWYLKWAKVVLLLSTMHHDDKVIVANQKSLNFTIRPNQVLMRWIKKSATTQHIAKHQDSRLLCSITSWIYQHIMHLSFTNSDLQLYMV